MMRFISRYAFSAVFTSLFLISTPAAAQPNTYIELLPNGTSDGSFPTVWVSTIKKQWEHAFEFNDVVTQKIYGDVRRYITTKFCATGSQSSTKIGPAYSSIIQEKSFGGRVTFSCNIDGTNTKKMIKGIKKIFRQNAVSSRGLDIWDSAG